MKHRQSVDDVKSATHLGISDKKSPSIVIFINPQASTVSVDTQTFTLLNLG